MTCHCACTFSIDFPEDGALSTCDYHTAAMDTATSELMREHRSALVKLAARCAGQHHHYSENLEYPWTKHELRARLEHAVRFCQRMTDALKKEAGL